MNKIYKLAAWLVTFTISVFSMNCRILPLTEEDDDDGGYYYVDYNEDEPGGGIYTDDDLVTVYDYNRGVYIVGTASNVACVLADTAWSKTAIPGKNTITVNNPAGEGTATVSGVIDVNGTTFSGSIDLEIVFEDWEAGGLVLSGEGTFIADVSPTLSGVETDGTIEGEYRIVQDGNEYAYQVDYDMTILSGLSTTFDFNGDVSVDGADFTIDNTWGEGAFN